MKKFKCVNCNFKVSFDELPENYRCPKCDAPKEAFVEEEKTKKPFILLFLYSLTIIVLIISGSFTISSIFNINKVDPDKIKVGTLSMKLVGQNDTLIRLIDSYPMSDEKAATLDPFHFKIENTGTYKVEYRLKLINVPLKELVNVKEIKGKDRINNTFVKYSLTDLEKGKIIKTGLVSDLENEILLQEKLDASSLRDFTFRVWIDESASNEAQNKFYAGRLVLEMNQLDD